VNLQVNVDQRVERRVGPEPAADAVKFDDRRLRNHRGSELC
jgi:hypothetical protein